MDGVRQDTPQQTFAGTTTCLPGRAPTAGRAATPGRATTLFLSGLLLIVAAALVAWPLVDASAHGGPSSSRGKPSSSRDKSSSARDKPIDFRFPTTGEKLIDVRIVGNTTIPASAIAKYIRLRPGRPLNDKLKRKDVHSLYSTGWFMTVEPVVRRTEEGLVLYYKVLEKPVVKRVEYLGNKKVKTKHLAARTGLKEGSPFDVSANRESAKRLEDYYHEQGYAFATVKLEKGDSLRDREVIFRIDEGPKVRVQGIRFDGNKSFSGALLKTKLRTKSAILWYFGGLYDPLTKDDDLAVIKQYYQSLGYFDVAVTHRVGFSKNGAGAYVEFKIDEGMRYKVGKVVFEGNRILAEKSLQQKLLLTSGEYFNTRHLDKDIAQISDKYYERGHLFADVQAVPQFHEQPGVADLIYRIQEDIPYYINRVNIHILGDHPRSKSSIVRNIIRTIPGELANRRLIKADERRLQGAQYFEPGPLNGPKINISRVLPDEPKDRLRAVRGQSQRDDEYRYPSVNRGDRYRHGRTRRHRVSNHSSRSGRPQPSRTSRPKRPTRDTKSGQWDPRQLDNVNEKADVEEHSLFVDPGELIPSAFYVRSPQRNSPYEESVIRGQNFDDPDPDIGQFGGNPQGDPLADRGLANADVYVTEARTGRMIFGVGVNSDAGVVGSFIISEQNFDILRPPRSFGDLINGNAWRGGGQRFRFEAVPGNIVSRYLVSWTDPYFMNTDYSVGLSAFYYNRFFSEWDEQRAGGRVQFGRQWTRQWSTNAAFRLEEVVIDNPDVPTPPILAAAVGSNILSTVRVAVTHDTRDAAFLPAAGHQLEFGYEQAFGDFSYPRFDASARQYFTTYSRPDGTGRHIFSLTGRAGWTGDETPIFENFFAGGFQSFRGFQFRGVGPRQSGVNVGGQWMLLGSAEYKIPIMANDSIHGVAFTDIGTVDTDVSLDAFRATAGIGLRVMVPGMGAAPLAFDLGFPVIREEGDETRIFSFYVGIIR